MKGATLCQKSVVAVLCLCITWFGLLSAAARADSDPFPCYSCLEPNVAFWKKIYSEYPLSQGVIHDKEDLSIIYEVIELEDREKPGARKINVKRIKQVKKRYAEILERLARGVPASTDEEQRVLDLFGDDPMPEDFREARRNIRFQLGQMDRFRQGVIRSGAYLEEMKSIFSSYGVPEELVYLAHVESSFNVKAYSKFGAAGVWQFTRSTGKRYMKVGYTLDERRDPIVSTHAAARFLKKNHEKLGSWPMAITAYNHGVAGMMRAREKKGDYESIFNEHNSRTFKFASRNFYSEFLAAKDVAQNYQQHFGSLQLDQPRPSFQIALKGYVPVKDLSRYFKVDLSTIRQLNPALRDPVFKGQKYIPKGYRLRLPMQDMNRVKLAMDIPNRLMKRGQKRSRFYRVRRGDTVGRIARRHGVKTATLIRANGLGRRATIYVGQNLQIPAAGKVAGPMLARSKKRSRAEKRVLLASVSGGLEGMIKPTPVSSPDSTVRAEEAVAVPLDKPEGAATINSAVMLGNLQVERTFQQGGRPVGVIRVEAEETLGHYAEWLEVRAQQVRRLNGLRFEDHIRIGQLIRVPLDKVGKELFQERRFEHHKEIEEDFFVAYRVENVRAYRIKKGDNLWRLCQAEFEVPLWLLRKYNSSVDFGSLKPAQQINIPVVAKIS